MATDALTASNGSCIGSGRRRRVQKRTTKDNLKDAAVHLLARGGPPAASVRSIAKRAGVTEAALYRHYRNKEDLYLSACAEIIEQMVTAKRRLIAADTSARAKITEWVRMTYMFYDENPDAFTCVLLRDDQPQQKLESIDGQQSGLFESLLLVGQSTGELRRMDPHLATALFSGMMLQVPKLVNEGGLPGPASNYAGLVAEAAIRLLGSDTGG